MSKLSLKRLQFHFVCIILLSSFVISCRSSSHQVETNTRKFLTEFFGSTDEIKYIFGFPIVFDFGYNWRCLVVARDSTCYDLVGAGWNDFISKNNLVRKHFFYLKPFAYRAPKCGKMINDSTIEFRTDLFGEIEVSVEHKPELAGKGIDIDFSLYRDKTGNRWSMTCTMWSVKKRDSLYTKPQYLYPMEAPLKYFPHKSGHISIPDSLGEIEAIRLIPGLMGGKFQILLDSINLSSLPNVKDKRKSPTQRINHIKVIHRASNKRRITLIGRITNDGLVVLNREGEPTKLILPELYPATHKPDPPELRFGHRGYYDLPILIR